MVEELLADVAEVRWRKPLDRVERIPLRNRVDDEDALSRVQLALRCGERRIAETGGIGGAFMVAVVLRDEIDILAKTFASGDGEGRLARASRAVEKDGETVFRWFALHHVRGELPMHLGNLAVEFPWERLVGAFCPEALGELSL